MMSSTFNRVTASVRTLRRNRFGAALLLGLAAWLISAPAANAWWNDDWLLRKKITIDLTSAGLPNGEALGNTGPVLIRLHSGNFRFASAKEDGSDLRFVAGDDKTPLKFQIEKYNALFNEAQIWVNIPDLKSAAKTEFFLYYGNRKATAVDTKGVYDADTLLVYHFAENGTPPQDSSIWANHALGPSRIIDGAQIGAGTHFDGTTVISVPDSPGLAIPENGTLTWSSWVSMGAAQPEAVLFSRKQDGSGLTIGLDSGVPFVQIDGVTPARTPAGAPITAGKWHHIAVVADAGTVTIYVDGERNTSSPGALPALSGKASIGGEADAAATPAPAATSDQPAADAAATTPGVVGGFVGDLDEMKIIKSARTPVAVRFAALVQGADFGKIIAYSEDEETSAWFTGYFAVILKSVTVDGWVVIALLGVMAVLSWIVIVDKVGYCGRQAKGNALFLEQFNADEDAFLRLEAEPDQPKGKPKTKAERAVRESSLRRLYQQAVQETIRRFSRGSGMKALSPQAITAIRASLDSIYVKEAQKLNRMMVMLTIAISGGPFLGLLGTVVGVMITFAAIAASGDVNVNAIAPGIAAALVATVAGLGVAIPALFAYNYLTIRIKDLSSDMQVFIDDLLARMAEEFHPGAQPTRQAAE